MSRFTLLVLVLVVAVCAAQLGRNNGGRGRGLRNRLRGRGGRGRGGFSRATDCFLEFGTQSNNQFCPAYVNQCSNMFDVPDSPQTSTCASCMFAWMMQCPINNNGR